jgi:hypothetical protein
LKKLIEKKIKGKVFFFVRFFSLRFGFVFFRFTDCVFTKKVMEIHYETEREEPRTQKYVEDSSWMVSTLLEEISRIDHHTRK